MMLIAEPEGVWAVVGRRGPLIGIGSAAAALLVAGTFVRFGLVAEGAAWSVAQLLLAFLAVFDAATRRVPNLVTLPAGVAVVVLRGAFAPATLTETALAGAIAFAGFFLLRVLTRGGLGMGDVKLAGLLGLLLGKAVLPALFVGVVVGGLAAAVVLVGRGRGRTMAYAPYLCFGGAVSILVFHVPQLV
jgi:leader peptidase (prepilin peptidase)/N-methyltransferase